MPSPLNLRQRLSSFSSQSNPSPTSIASSDATLEATSETSENSSRRLSIRAMLHLPGSNRISPDAGRAPRVPSPTRDSEATLQQDPLRTETRSSSGSSSATKLSSSPLPEAVVEAPVRRVVTPDEVTTTFFGSPESRCASPDMSQDEDPLEWAIQEKEEELADFEVMLEPMRREFWMNEKKSLKTLRRLDKVSDLRYETLNAQQKLLDPDTPPSPLEARKLQTRLEDIAFDSYHLKKQMNELLKHYDQLQAQFEPLVDDKINLEKQLEILKKRRHEAAVPDAEEASLKP